MAKTVKEIKAEKSEVEGKILKMLKDLEASSGMNLGNDPDSIDAPVVRG